MVVLRLLRSRSEKTNRNTGDPNLRHNSTVFAQLLKLVPRQPRHEFERLAREHESGRKARKLTRWSQFVAMGMAQLAGRISLRDIRVEPVGAQSRKVYHLGAGKVSRSSLSRVNADKPWELFGRLLSRCRASSPGHGFRFKNKLHSLDATVIDLCLSMFPWARFRRAKGALKVHAGMDHEGGLPTFVTVTEGQTSK